MASQSALVDVARSGPGALCPEAQADGVPCTCLGIDCVACASAATTRLPAVPPPRPEPESSQSPGSADA
jgi:hypothetical protein